MREQHRPRRHSVLIGDSAASNDEVWRANQRTRLANWTAPWLYDQRVTVEAARELSMFERYAAIRSAWPDDRGVFLDDSVWALTLSALAIYWQSEIDASDPFDGQL